MAQWREETMNVNGINIHYHLVGDPQQKPTVVLLHGMTDSGLCWTHIAHALEDEYALIMPDARGHGHSERGEAGLDQESLAADVAGLIQELRLDRPYLLGHSMGGMTALVVAARYPKLVRAILLEDPPLIDRSEHMADNQRPRAGIPPWLARLKPMTKEEMLTHIRAESPQWDEEEYEPWVDSKVDVDPAIFEQWRSLPSWRELAAMVHCPVLLITGDPSLHAIVTPQVAVDALHYWPEGQLIQVAGAGHNIRRDKYPEFIRAVKAFLQQMQAHQAQQ
ncbi:alpha/beta fold hydrolase [Dictyobacter aurantiacus]|uniref:Alpha/beta hydrolase n=1 Tax=Dictyobacter aurantiacus TaxID=1936993 RepID=A0A401ZPP9_9CHLR|nr:alpha/beta hydrolase [Dictyobacter aurantiacus]GCE08812.1 alpha/beta hydrolase [Dictyobacter aurantiacus]